MSSNNRGRDGHRGRGRGREGSGGRRTAIVIGGGVIGLSAAYHLARKKFGRIIVLEKGAIGEGSSSRAAGITTGLLWSETGIRARKKGIELFEQDRKSVV